MTERGKAGHGSVEISLHVWVSAPRHLKNADRVLDPLGSDVLKNTKLAPEVTEPLDVGNLVVRMSLPKPFKPGSSKLALNGRLGNDGHQILNRAIDRATQRT